MFGHSDGTWSDQGRLMVTKKAEDYECRLDPANGAVFAERCDVTQPGVLANVRHSKPTLVSSAKHYTSNTIGLLSSTSDLGYSGLPKNPHVATRSSQAVSRTHRSKMTSSQTVPAFRAVNTPTVATQTSCNSCVSWNEGAHFMAVESTQSSSLSIVSNYLSSSTSQPTSSAPEFGTSSPSTSVTPRAAVPAAKFTLPKIGKEASGSTTKTQPHLTHAEKRSSVTANRKSHITAEPILADFPPIPKTTTHLSIAYSQSSAILAKYSMTSRAAQTSLSSNLQVPIDEIFGPSVVLHSESENDGSVSQGSLAKYPTSTSRAGQTPPSSKPRIPNGEIFGSFVTLPSESKDDGKTVQSMLTRSTRTGSALASSRHTSACKPIRTPVLRLRQRLYWNTGCQRLGPRAQVCKIEGVDGREPGNSVQTSEPNSAPDTTVKVSTGPTLVASDSIVPGFASTFVPDRRIDIAKTTTPLTRTTGRRITSHSSVPGGNSLLSPVSNRNIKAIPATTLSAKARSTQDAMGLAASHGSIGTTTAGISTTRTKNAHLSSSTTVPNVELLSVALLDQGISDTNPTQSVSVRTERSPTSGPGGLSVAKPVLVHMSKESGQPPTIATLSSKTRDVPSAGHRTEAKTDAPSVSPPLGKLASSPIRPTLPFPLPTKSSVIYTSPVGEVSSCPSGAQCPKNSSSIVETLLPDSNGVASQQAKKISSKTLFKATRTHGSFDDSRTEMLGDAVAATRHADNAMPRHSHTPSRTMKIIEPMTDVINAGPTSTYEITNCAPTATDCTIGKVRAEVIVTRPRSDSPAAVALATSKKILNGNGPTPVPNVEREGSVVVTQTQSSMRCVHDGKDCSFVETSTRPRKSTPRLTSTHVQPPASKETVGAAESGSDAITTCASEAGGCSVDTSTAQVVTRTFRSGKIVHAPESGTTSSREASSELRAESTATKGRTFHPFSKSGDTGDVPDGPEHVFKSGSRLSHGLSGSKSLAPTVGSVLEPHNVSPVTAELLPLASGSRHSQAHVTLVNQAITVESGFAPHPSSPEAAQRLPHDSPSVTTHSPGHVPKGAFASVVGLPPAGPAAAETLPEQLLHDSSNLPGTKESIPPTAIAKESVPSVGSSLPLMPAAAEEPPRRLQHVSSSLADAKESILPVANAKGNIPLVGTSLPVMPVAAENPSGRLLDNPSYPAGTKETLPQVAGAEERIPSVGNLLPATSAAAENLPGQLLDSNRDVAGPRDDMSSVGGAKDNIPSVAGAKENIASVGSSLPAMPATAENRLGQHLATHSNVAAAGDEISSVAGAKDNIPSVTGTKENIASVGSSLPAILAGVENLPGRLLDSPSNIAGAKEYVPSVASPTENIQSAASPIPAAPAVIKSLPSLPQIRPDGMNDSHDAPSIEPALDFEESPAPTTAGKIRTSQRPSCVVNSPQSVAQGLSPSSAPFAATPIAVKDLPTSKVVDAPDTLATSPESAAVQLPAEPMEVKDVPGQPDSRSGVMADDHEGPIASADPRLSGLYASKDISSRPPSRATGGNSLSREPADTPFSVSGQTSSTPPGTERSSGRPVSRPHQPVVPGLPRTDRSHPSAANISLGHTGIPTTLLSKLSNVSPILVTNSSLPRNSASPVVGNKPQLTAKPADQGCEGDHCSPHPADTSGATKATLSAWMLICLAVL